MIGHMMKSKKIICYERDKNYKFVYFKKEFWEKFFLHNKMNENEENKILKLVNLYKLLLSCIDLGKDDSEYKVTLAENIHKLIMQKIEKISQTKEQLSLLFNNDHHLKEKAECEIEYDFDEGSSTDSNKVLKNEIYYSAKVYTSDCCGFEKSHKIKKDIEKNGESYHYFGIGDDINKEESFKKLKKFLKYNIKGSFKPSIHLDLYYTNNIPLMKYFLFAILTTKLHKANDNILYIPKYINICVEIPNRHQQFLDEYPILKIFKKNYINIALDK